MWYDETGLFKPAAIHPENGYRCYNYHQSPILETILLLRELDVSIPEIQDFMKNRSAQNMKCLLDEKTAELDLQLLHLQAVKKPYPATGRTWIPCWLWIYLKSVLWRKKKGAW